MDVVKIDNPDLFYGWRLYQHSRLLQTMRPICICRAALAMLIASAIKITALPVLQVN
jgi:hypothetical protein